MSEIEPRWTEPHDAAGIGARFDALVARTVESTRRFARDFRTHLYVIPDGWISLTELDDDFHSMRVALRIDTDGVITDAAGRMLRYPFGTCPRALESLQRFVGANLAVPGAHNQIKERMPRTDGCLHVADMLTVAFRAFRISKGHDLDSYHGEETRRSLLQFANMHDTCVSFAVARDD